MHSLVPASRTLHLWSYEKPVDSICCKRKGVILSFLHKKLELSTKYSHIPVFDNVDLDYRSLSYDI